MPYIRPLGRLPATFGLEWALTPPHFSLRSELRALYAAIMRTVCLSAEAIRDAARWDHYRSPVPLPPKPAAAPIAAATEGSLAAAQARSASVTPPDSSTPSLGRNKLAGGAVAIGGAALLAWIVASHAPHEPATVTTKASPRSDASAEHDASQRLADARAQHEHVIAGAVRQTAAQPPAPAPTAPAPLSPVATTSKRAEALIPEMADKPAQAPVRMAANERKPLQANVHTRTQPEFDVYTRSKAASPARLVQREARHDRAVKRAAGQHIAERSAKLRDDAHKFEPYREAQPVTTRRPDATYSKAHEYSPRQTGANPADEYASILTYANTYAAAHTSNPPAVPVNNTDWVNHVSQRRVTEVPDRFEK